MKDYKTEVQPSGFIAKPTTDDDRLEKIMPMFYMFENPRRGRQARNFYYNGSENSRSQIVFRTDIFRKLTLGAPEVEPFSFFHLLR